MAASTPNFPFVLRDWTFQTKKIELSNENQRWKIQRQPYCFFPPIWHYTVHSPQSWCSLYALIQNNLVWKKDKKSRALFKPWFGVRRGGGVGSFDKTPISSLNLEKIHFLRKIWRILIMIMKMMSIKMMMVMTTRMTARVELIRRLLSGEISHCTASHHQLVKGLSLAGRSNDSDHCFAGPLCQNPDFFSFFTFQGSP